MDCGPTCLAMISKSYGKNYNIEHLHDLCNISNEGASLYGISIAAEKIGFHTVGTQLSLIQLIDEMPLPCILHWNQNHFVVLYKIKKTKKGCAFFCVIFEMFTPLARIVLIIHTTCVRN